MAALAAGSGREETSLTLTPVVKKSLQPKALLTHEVKEEQPAVAGGSTDPGQGRRGEPALVDGPLQAAAAAAQQPDSLMSSGAAATRPLQEDFDSKEIIKEPVADAAELELSAESLQAKARHPHDAQP